MLAWMYAPLRQGADIPDLHDEETVEPGRRSSFIPELGRNVPL